MYADVAELADALDLGSSIFDVGVQVPSSAFGVESIALSPFFFFFYMWRYICGDEY